MRQVRYPIILSRKQKKMAYDVVKAFKQVPFLCSCLAPCLPAALDRPASAPSLWCELYVRVGGG